MADDDSASLNRRQFLQSASLAALGPYALTGDSDTASRTSSDDLPALRAKLLDTVPEPVIPERPELKEMYETCWVIGYQQTHYGTPENGFVRWYIDEAFDNRLFQWDLCFALAWAKYGQGALPGMESLDNFYRKQHGDGAIAGVIKELDGSDDQPKDAPWFTRNNLFSWIEYEYYRTTGDASRLERVVPVLRDYARWVKENRRHENGHYYWSGWSSGMDNSPRSVADEFYPPYSWVDYDANEALAAYYLAEMADVTGDTAVAQEFRSLHAEIKKLVNREMWSEADQFYWDLDKDGSFLKEKTVASFWPMWGRIADKKHADGLVQHLNNEEEFNRPHRVPTLSADHPEYDPEGDYWRGSVWAPTNHMIVKGLTACGRHELARTIVENHLENVSTVFQETGTVWENYAPESASPGEPASPDFVGWSADGPIAQLIEYYIGIRPDVPSNRIDWMLLTDEKVGVRNLDFGGVTIHLVAEGRVSTEAPIDLTLRTPRSFTLCLQDGENTVEVDVEPSKQAYRVDLRAGTVQRKRE